MHDKHPEWDSGSEHIFQNSKTLLAVVCGKWLYKCYIIFKYLLIITVPDSSDDGKHEDAVHHPALHEERDTEDNYHINNTKDDIILGNIPPTGYSSDDKNFHTGSSDKLVSNHMESGESL